MNRKYATIQNFGKMLLKSFMPHLFDKKYSKNCNIVKY